MRVSSGVKYRIALASWGAVILASSLSIAQPAALPEQPPESAAGQTPSEGTANAEAPTEEPKLKRGGLVFEDVGFAGLDFNPTGQYKIRFRHEEGRDFVAGGNANTARHRARLGFGVTYQDAVGGMIQVQDVRVFGSERNTLGDFSADGFDLHQGYLRLMPIEGLEIRIGRQEIAFENHRLIGNVGWIEQARSFDAGRLMFESGMLKLDSFYAKVSEASASPLDATGAPIFTEDRDVLGFNLHIAPFDELEVAPIFIGDFGGNDGTRRLTVGGLVTGKTAFGLSYGGEGYYQHGNANGDVAYRAFLVGGYLGFKAKVNTQPFVRAFADVLSGDAAPGDGTRRTFNTLFHTGHKFYGEMDFFLNLPADTFQRGLADIGGTVGLSPMKLMKAYATLHHFRATADQGDGLGTFGNELDLKIDYKPWPLFTIDLLYGLFAPGDIFEVGRSNTKLEHFLYSTADFGF